MLFISLFVLMGLIKPSLQVFFFTTCTSSNVVHIYAAPSLLNRCTLNTVARRKKEVRETWVRHRIIFAFHFLFFRGNRKQKEKKNRKYDEMRTKARLQHPQRAAATPRFFFFCCCCCSSFLFASRSFTQKWRALWKKKRKTTETTELPKQAKKKKIPRHSDSNNENENKKKKSFYDDVLTVIKKKKRRKQIERMK